MDARPSMRPSKPPTVAELAAQGENFAFNTNISLKHWMRTAETLYQEANFALSDGDYGRAYVMLYRHSVLVLKCLPKHPQYRDPETRQACRSLSKRVNRVLDDIAQLKPLIEQSVKEWERMKPTDKLQEPRKSDASLSYADFAARDPTLSGNAKILDASEHQDLAVDLAQKELRRRDIVRHASRHEATQSNGSLVVGNGDHINAGPDADLRSQMEMARRNLDSPGSWNQGDSGASGPKGYSSNFVSQSYNYPLVSRSQPVACEGTTSQSQDSAGPAPPQPDRPPKEPTYSLYREGQQGPPRIPQKVQLESYESLVPSSAQQEPHYQAPMLPPKTSSDFTPAAHKKERLTFKPGAYLENGDPIRSIFLPRGIRESFLDIAAPNTRAGIEMCGILCGTPINNALFVRCLLIPDQTCTPDTCETENESAMFDYCDREDLLVIGWIHTHPTQTCFMSSRDLHTQAGYQIMMPESVAVVCSPKFSPRCVFFEMFPPEDSKTEANAPRTVTAYFV
ncbi:STAM-binding protein [Geosmithia morbida]|uniref:STAM-binding protein n=1 Tax=Geosmithia morbida TaxID=1094350 RepID=A0A9P5D3J0_9HYPO|nr:STAM-binding protein [Geosmithia morbida]KAF4126243.1 STAM-binding protein [Geosmithia morbida]